MQHKIFRFFLFVILTLGYGVKNDAVAQDPEFTQFYANPLYLNPAFAGSAHCPRAALNYRNQWSGISGNFITSSASYDQHVDALAGGVGLLAWYDIAGEGVLTTTNVSGIYSYQISVNKKFSLKLGVQATWAQKKIDWSTLTFGDQIHAQRGFIYNTGEIQTDAPASYADFSAGVLGFSEKYFFGFAVNHLTEPNESLVSANSPLPRKYTFHAGGIIPITGNDEGPSLSPNILVQSQQSFLQMNIGVYFTQNPIILGAWYRLTRENGDAFIALAGFQTGIFKFGYSYDYTVSQLGRTGGSHEVSLGIQFECQPRKEKFKTVNCPAF